MIRAVIDTNVFVSGLISPHGVPGKILRAWEEKRIVVLVNRAILDEIQEVLLRPQIRKYHRLTDKQVEEFCGHIEQFGILIQQSKKLPHLSIDPDDLKLMDCAIAGKAEFLVTGDKELLNLGMIGELSVVSPSVFAEKVRI